MSYTQPMPLADRISQYRITARATVNKDFVPRDKWDETARHYNVTLSRPAREGKRVMHTEFHMGSAHTKPPKAIDVMSSLLLDASMVVDFSFEDWAGDLGYDTDSRKAEKMFRDLQGQTESLRNFLLDDQSPWDIWLYQTDNDL